MNLEPEGEPELTFSQRMMLNKAHTFITKRMEKRQRVHQQKRNKKLMMKLSKMIQNKLMFGSPSAGGQIQSLGAITLPAGFTFGKSSPENPI
jgi:hypothetical protein